MFYYIDKPRTPSFPMALVKTESDFIVISAGKNITTRLLHQQVKIPG